MKRTVLFTATLASALGLFALGATAQQQSAQTQERMSIAEVATMLEGQGYQVLEIELGRSRFEAEMIDANGMKVEADLHPVTGEVLRDREDDRYDDDDRYHERDHD